MSTARKVSIYLIIISIIPFILGIILPLILPVESYTHSGTVLIEEKDLQSFKYWITSPEAKNASFNCIDNRDNVVINFEVVTKDKESLFGENVYKNRQSCYVFIMFTSFLLLAPAIFLWDE